MPRYPKRQHCPAIYALALCGSLGICMAGPALAQAPAAKAATTKAPQGAAPGKAEAIDPITELTNQLRGSEDQAIDAAQKLATTPGAKATDALLQELALGTPPRITAALLEAMAPRKDPRSLETLSVYAKNRSPDLRRRAVFAIGEIPETKAVPVLLAALSDPAAEVRQAAATALGNRKEKSAEPKLLKLLAQKDRAAPQALGAIGGPETARTLAEMVGNVPDRLLVQTLGELLKRQDFGPDPLRLEVVKTLGKIPTSDALDALSDYVKASAKDKARPSRTEATKIIEQRTAK